jgi:ATP-dependent helicase/nuclease subunit A
MNDDSALGLIVGDSMTACAEGVAEEIARICGLRLEPEITQDDRLGLRLQPELTLIRDRTTGLARPARPADIAILMRARDAHREFEKALERRGVATYVYKGLGFFDADEVQDAVAILRYLADPSSNMRAATLLRSRIVRLSDPALALLAPSLGAALLAAEPPDVVSQFAADDRAVFERLRASLGAWLPLVDRVPPADLLRRVLSDTGYERELTGGRARQAHENLKKLMAMVRRFQNRGYATLARVADHLDELATGDESNAAIDAHEAVSLMTVHAAKGLEFPIVFVVNVNRGTGNTRAPIRVAAQPDGEDSVAIADYQSEADEDAAARDREETKRLLYVALTRARDRLYLGASLANGTFRATRGSLGEVFPPSLKVLLEQAGRDGPELGWDGAEQRRHRFRVAGV